MCDQSNSWPIEIFFESLYTMIDMGLRADDQLGFEKMGPHHALKTVVALYYNAAALHCSSTSIHNTSKGMSGEYFLKKMNMILL